MADTQTLEVDSFDGLDAPPEEKKPSIIDEKKPPIETKVETPIVDKKPDAPKDPDEDEILDANEYLKKELGYDDWDTAKKEIDGLKKKASEPAPFKYADEVSEKIHKALLEGKTDPLYEYLDTKSKIGKLVTGEVTEKNAPDIIKAAMKVKFKESNLTDEEINRKFNKQFSISKEPVQTLEETSVEFDARKEEWKEQVEGIKSDMIMEAKVTRPDLAKLITELKLPEIAAPQLIQKEPTPEEQELSKKNMEVFMLNAKSDIDKFDGFTVDYVDPKDKDVNIKSTYTLSNDEKAGVLAKIQLLAEGNYNSNVLFAERWVNKDETFNFQQMAKDLAILETYDKSAQKFVGDAVNKARKQFIKEKKNTDLSNDGAGNLVQLEDKTEHQKMEDAIWN
jgi:hypothetical protein